jgi:hypothetical protein
MGLSLQHILRYADEGDDMLNRVVTGDESWVHQYQPESKRSSVQWKPHFTSNQKLYGYAISWEGYAYRVFGFSGSTVSHFQKHGANT